MIELLTTTAQIERLAPEWSALWDRCPHATPFQTPEWLLPWWRHFGRGELRVLALRSGGRLVGLAPLYVADRRAGFLGEGISDYLDVLLEPGVPAGPVLLRLRTLDCDLCELNDLPPQSPLAQADQAQDGSPCPVLVLPASFPHGIRRNLARYGRQIGETRYQTADRTTLSEHMEALFRLHRARWNGAGVLADPRLQAFHREAAAAFLDRGCLRLHSLRRNDEIAAVLYGFAARGRFYAYLSGFDPALARFSPGLLIIAFALEQAGRDGAREFDFLRGNEPYKYAWGARDRFNRRLSIHTVLA